MSDAPRKPFGYGKPQPGAAPKPAPKKAPPQPAFEVVEDEPEFEVVEDVADFEVVQEEEPKPKKNLVPVAKKAAREVDDDDDDDEPKKSKNRKKRKMDDLSAQLLAKQDEDDERRAAALRHFEWTIPSVLLVIGLALSITGAFGAAKGVSGIFTLGVLAVFVCTYVPLAIVALMVVGLMMGINYGRLWPAVLKMSAITFIVNGIWLFGDWMKLPIFLIAPISCFISYGIFMTQFDLDTSETGTSVGVLNIMTFIANIILIGFLVVGEAATRGGKSDPDGDDPPVERKERKRDRDKTPSNPNNSPVMNDDDDD